MTAPRPKSALVQSAVAEHFKVTRAAMNGTRGAPSITRPRQVGYFLCRSLTRKSLSQIARAFHRSDHTTVLWGIRRIDAALGSDPDLRASVAAIRLAIDERMRAGA